MDRPYTSLLVLVLVAAVGRAAVQKINVPKCCPSGEVYSFGDGRCVAGAAVGTSWPPPIYKTSGVGMVNVALRGFRDLVGLVSCGNGTIASSSRNFKLFADDTLETESGDRLSAGQFCVERALADEDPAATEFIARFCVPDPCETQECVRKCCPPGYAMEQSSEGRCRMSESAFSVRLHNETGFPIDSDKLIIRAGILPDCPYGINLLDDVANPTDRFFVLPSGQFFVPDYPEGDQLANDYCIDNFFFGDQMVLWII